MINSKKNQNIKLKNARNSKVNASVKKINLKLYRKNWMTYGKDKTLRKKMQNWLQNMKLRVNQEKL